MRGAVTPTRESLERAVAGEDFDAAVVALVELGRLHEREGRVAEAEDAFREVLSTGHSGQAPRAAYELARILEARGATDEARSAYRYLLSGGATEYSAPAICALRRLPPAEPVS